MIIASVDINKDILLPTATQIVGVVIGGVIAFFIAGWQLVRQEREQNFSNRMYLEELYDRVRIELRDNVNLILNRLAEAVEESDTFDEHWAYIRSIADSLEFTAYRMLQTSGLMKLLQRNIVKSISSAYSDIESLRRMIIMNQMAQAYYKSVDKHEIAELQIKNLQNYRRTIESGLKEDFKIVVKRKSYEGRLPSTYY